MIYFESTKNFTGIKKEEQVLETKKIGDCSETEHSFSETKPDSTCQCGKYFYRAAQANSEII